MTRPDLDILEKYAESLVNAGYRAGLGQDSWQAKRTLRVIAYARELEQQLADMWAQKAQQTYIEASMDNLSLIKRHELMRKLIADNERILNRLKDAMEDEA